MSGPRENRVWVVYAQGDPAAKAHRRPAQLERAAEAAKPGGHCFFGHATHHPPVGPR
jgi:hypothetical protein